jgi:excisionase family DNA binding protein
MQDTAHSRHHGKFLSTREVASEMGISPDRVRQLAAQGILPAIQWTARGRLRFRAEDVARVLVPRQVAVRDDGA